MKSNPITVNTYPFLFCTFHSLCIWRFSFQHQQYITTKYVLAYNQSENIWYILITLSSLVGLLVAKYMRHKLSIFVAGAVPWLGLLGSLLYTEYFVPYQGGGASMWPVAQLFGGTAAAVIGVVVFFVARKFIWPIKDAH